MKAKVYFSRTITPEMVLELYKTLGVTLPGKVAVKVHSGEPGNQNFLRPDFWKPMVDHVNGTITECNTAYSGGRNTTDKHLKTMAQPLFSPTSKAIPWVDMAAQSNSCPLALHLPSGKTIYTAEERMNPGP